MKRVLVFSFLILAFSGALFAQNANIAQSIIGTWVDHTGNTWVFNANGTLTRQIWGTNARTGDKSRSSIEEKFAVADTKLVVIDGIIKGLTDESDAIASSFDISMSSDGKTLILTGNYSSRSSSGVISSISRSTYLLTKK